MGIGVSWGVNGDKRTTKCTKRWLINALTNAGTLGLFLC